MSEGPCGGTVLGGGRVTKVWPLKPNLGTKITGTGIAVIILSQPSRLNTSMLNIPPDPRPEPSSQLGDVTAILTPDSTSPGPDATTSASPLLVGPSDQMTSEGKRKQEDDSETALDASTTRKKLKLEASDTDEFPLIKSEAVSDAVDNPANVRDALRLRHHC